jgi:DNA-binding MarR family transcriptional regulator
MKRTTRSAYEPRGESKPAKRTRTRLHRIEDCVSFMLGKALQQVAQDAKQRLVELGVTPVQYAVLKVLWETDEQSASQLGARLVLDSATMTGLIDRLERSGLVERRSHRSDRRVNCVALTPAGRALEAPLDREMEAMNDAFLGEFGAAELERFRAMLGAIARARPMAGRSHEA